MSNSIESGEQLQINESKQPKSDDGSPDMSEDVVLEGQPTELEMNQKEVKTSWKNSLNLIII